MLDTIAGMDSEHCIPRSRNEIRQPSVVDATDWVASPRIGTLTTPYVNAPVEHAVDGMQ
eukprot:COSAG02_NODE_25034_length_670_cov_1.418564_1_plen_58_part_01